MHRSLHMCVINTTSNISMLEQVNVVHTLCMVTYIEIMNITKSCKNTNERCTYVVHGNIHVGIKNIKNTAA